MDVFFSSRCPLLTVGEMCLSLPPMFSCSFIMIIFFDLSVILLSRCACNFLNIFLTSQAHDQLLLFSFFFSSVFLWLLNPMNRMVNCFLFCFLILGNELIFSVDFFLSVGSPRALSYSRVPTEGFCICFCWEPQGFHKWLLGIFVVAICWDFHLNYLDGINSDSTSTLCTKLVLWFLTGDVKIVFHQDRQTERSLLATFWGQWEGNPSCCLSWLFSYKLSALTLSLSRLHFWMGWDSANYISLLPSSSLSAFANGGLRMGVGDWGRGKRLIAGSLLLKRHLGDGHHPSDDGGSSF